MDIISSTSSYLMQFFQEFYREVLIQRDIAYKSIDVAPAVKEVSQEEIEVNPSEAVESKEVLTEEEKQNVHLVEEEDVCDRIQQTFRIMFERFSLTTQNQPGEFARAHFQEALYAMVSLLDEVFLGFSWKGKDRWENNLIEKQIFHTQVAGELTFRKIEELIQANDPMQRDLAVVYLMVLSLGFKGKYRGEDDEGRLNWYRQQLYVMVNHKPVSLYHPGMAHLIEECYDHIIAVPPVKVLPNVRNWVVAFFAIIAVFVIVTTFLSYKIYRDMDKAIGQILTQAQKLDY